MDPVLMLAGAVGALWIALGYLAKELRALWTRALDDRDRTIEELKAEARATTEAKNQELAEWRRLAFEAASRGTVGSEARQ